MKRMLQNTTRTAAEHTPDALAVVGAQDALTYDGLDRYANRMAATLVDMGCRRGDRVALHMPRSAHAVATMIGVLKAGCAYVPLATGDGIVRKAAVLRRSEPAVVLFERTPPEVVAALDLRGTLRGARLGWLDATDAPFPVAFGRADVEQASDADRTASGQDDDLAYILFSSRGRTGSRPRGVPMTHARVAAFVDRAVRHFDLGPGDHVAGPSDYSFDLSTLHIHGTLAAGATLHDVPVGTADETVGFMAERGITFWSSVPSTLSRLVRSEAIGSADLSSLREVAWYGDPLPGPDLLRLKDRLPDAILTNLYGAAETAVANSFYRVPDDYADPSADVPIGIAGEEGRLHVLDADLRPVPMGVPGEIYIGGDGVAGGYWREPEETRRAFTARGGLGRLVRTGDLGRVDSDGCVRLIGRDDAMVYGASPVPATLVENALLQLPEIRACAVVPDTTTGARATSVACAYVPSGRTHLRASTVHERLAGRVPADVIPTRWLLLDELPLDARGKVDRAHTRALLGG